MRLILVYKSSWISCVRFHHFLVDERPIDACDDDLGHYGQRLRYVIESHETGHLTGVLAVWKVCRDAEICKHQADAPIGQVLLKAAISVEDVPFDNNVDLNQSENDPEHVLPAR